MHENFVNQEMDSRERFIELYQMNFDYVYSFVFARTGGDSQTSEEIVQETFAAAYASMGSFSQKSSCKTWLCGIAKNKLTDHYRRTVRYQNSLISGEIDIYGISSNFNLEEMVSEDETRQYVIRVLGSINPIYSFALIMKYLDGYSIKEIAKVLKRTPKAVEGILQRAKSSFSELFDQVSGGKSNG